MEERRKQYEDSTDEIQSVKKNEVSKHGVGGGGGGGKESVLIEIDWRTVDAHLLKHDDEEEEEDKSRVERERKLKWNAPVLSSQKQSRQSQLPSTNISPPSKAGGKGARRASSSSSSSSSSSGSNSSLANATTVAVPKRGRRVRKKWEINETESSSSSSSSSSTTMTSNYEGNGNSKHNNAGSELMLLNNNVNINNIRNIPTSSSSSIINDKQALAYQQAANANANVPMMIQHSESNSAGKSRNHFPVSAETALPKSMLKDQGGGGGGGGHGLSSDRLRPRTAEEESRHKNIEQILEQVFFFFSRNF
jgi:hypothetical protein